MEFQEDFIEKLIADRERELNNPDIGLSLINRLSQEINYLKALLIRHQIAVILKLDKDPNYMNQDYFGIEEVDLNSYDLNADEIEKIMELRVQLPSEQLAIYRKRKKLADILKYNSERQANGLDGIEFFNQFDTFNLSEEEKREFSQLAEEIRSMGESTTRFVNYRKEAFTEIVDALAHLDTSDMEKYLEIRDEYFEKIDKAIKMAPEDYVSSLFEDVVNYRLALDLMEKYHDKKVTIRMQGLGDLFDTLQTAELDEEEYARCLELFCNSANKLYSNESNKQKVVELLNSAEDLDVRLRVALISKLVRMDNIDFNFKDSEIAGLIRLLNNRYSELDEATRDSIYRVIEDKITNLSSNIQTIEVANQLMMQVTNPDLESRLRKKFATNPNIKFRNQHDTPYQSIVNDTIESLKKERAQCVRKKEKAHFDARYDIRIREIDKEIAALQEMELDPNRKIESLDRSYNKNIDKIIKLEKDVARLKELRNIVKLRVMQHSIEKKIEKREKKIKKLESKKVKIVGKQTKKLIPAINKKINEDRKLRKHEARAEVFHSYARDYAKAAETERELKGMFSGIKAAFYDMRANRYEKKAIANMMMCEKLRDRKITLRGGNKKRINADVYDQILSQQQQNVQSI